MTDLTDKNETQKLTTDGSDHIENINDNLDVNKEAFKVDTRELADAFETNLVINDENKKQEVKNSHDSDNAVNVDNHVYKTNESDFEDTGKLNDENANIKPKSSKENDANDNIYHIKWIEFNKKRAPIILQNENGPCPLIAIANILSLKQIIRLDSGTEFITSRNLIAHLGDALLQLKPKVLDADEELNFNQNFSDALGLLHKLQFGLDVNVKFNGVNSFEYTRELNIFDVFNIKLYHGWLVDPQQVEIVSIIDNLSYNQLVERIIFLKNSDSQIDIAKGIQAEEFLESTQSQLTYHGLIELQSALKPNELAVFFRNNHFSTIHKYNDHLYLLATDQGFLQRHEIVWETLQSIDGDIYYCNSNFRLSKEENYTRASNTNDYNINNEQLNLNENADYQYALEIQKKMDEACAIKMQEEEERRARDEENRYRQQQKQQQQQRNQQSQQQHESISDEGRKKKKDKDKCLFM